MARYLLLPVFAASAGACSGPAAMPDAGADADGGELAGGVHLRFRVTPEIDDEVAIDDATLALHEMEVELSDIRLIGDAASGDARTHIDWVLLEWDEDLGPVSSVSYPDAPPGLYSIVRGAITKFEFEIDVERVGFEDFTIKVGYEDEPIAIDIALSSQLEAGQSLELDIEMDLAEVLAAIELEGLEPVNGEVEIRDELLLGAFADALANSFTAQQIR